MTQTCSSPRTGRTPARKPLAVPVLLQILAMIGLGAVLYPSAADWFATRNHNAEISGYVTQVASQPGAELATKRALADQYNQALRPGMLRDPYSHPDHPQPNDPTATHYHQFVVALPAGMLGELSYPRLGIALPIHPNTDPDTLTRGVGHLYGSSLPVGGPGTNTVLTSHSGLWHAKLFTDLPQAQIGDQFQLKVLGETLTYQVDDIRTMLPEQTELLQITANADLVTLITCTPIGINSHRLLVQGHRIPNPSSAATQVIPGDGVLAGFAWWALAFTAGSLGVGWLLFAPRRTRTDPDGRSTP